ncbi:alpha-galactosidase [Nocardioides sp. B-3]|nr:alpha-galactosidase [Nocardioides sp. B-3]UUZ57804.1 alpha-galactosidase [Nocardioides sp. B-3]
MPRPSSRSGVPGFTTTDGRVVAVHVAWSGNSVLRVERSAATGTTIGGGEHLLPGEVVLAEGESYETPRVHFVAAANGLDEVAGARHAYARSLPAHPDLQPVVLNVWEAVYFDHDLDRLRDIGDRAAAVGAGALRARRRLVPGPTRRHGRPGRLVGRRQRVAGRPRAADRSRPRTGDGVRAVVRARDGQPRLRPVSRASRVGDVLRAPAAAAAPQPVGARSDPPGRLRPHPGATRLAPRAPTRSAM